MQTDKKYALLSSGILIDPSDLQPGDIRVSDLVTSASRLNRYMGHTRVDREPYSVAQHSVLVHGMMVMDENEIGLCARSPLLKMGLCHDLAECYLSDLHPMVKAACPDYKALERRTEAVLWERLGLPSPDHDAWQIIKHYDDLILGLEIPQLFPESSPVNEYIPDVPAHLQFEIPEITWREAREALAQHLKRYNIV